jgi:hypothetical protein
MYNAARELVVAGAKTVVRTNVPGGNATFDSPEATDAEAARYAWTTARRNSSQARRSLGDRT